MHKFSSIFQGRNLWVYYTIFFSGALALSYQALDWSFLGDSVTFLCILFFLNGFLAKRPLHIIENSFLMTLGYILPLLIRNSLKLSYVEAPKMGDFLHLAMISTSTTLALGCAFSCLGFASALAGGKIAKLSRSKITTRSLND